MASRSDEDPHTWNIPFKTIPDFTGKATDSDLKVIHIGIPRNSFLRESNGLMIQSFGKALVKLRSAGANIVDQANVCEAEEYLKFRLKVHGVVDTTGSK